MTALILGFIAGYIGFATTLRDTRLDLLGLIVPGVFFSGACFVWLTVRLSLRTTLDVMRIDLLAHEAVTDALTDVFNRRYLDRRLVEEIERARRYQLPLSVLLFDIDHFKRINDGFGHQTGDCVLAALAQLLKAAKCDTDVLARYGGEEFMLIAPHTHGWSAAKLAERLRQCIEAHDFALPAHADSSGVERTSSGPVTSSVGVVSLGGGIDSPAALIKAADANLYRAKQGGRNRVVADVPSDSAAILATDGGASVG
ncbi:MAG: GGDEF domain-containing protein [Porticoccaceae bacterium]